MFGLGMPEILTIMVIALIIFGPRKLPEIGRTAGKFIHEFRQASQQIENQVKMEFREVEREKREAEKQKKEAEKQEKEAEEQKKSEEANSNEVENEEEQADKKVEAGGSN